MSLMDEALSIHAERLNESAGSPVLYIRGTYELSVTAVIGQTIFDDLTADGEVRTQIKSVDFLITPGVLRIGGSLVEPQRGDRIKKKSGEVYDVMPGSSGTAWQWSDGRQTFYRIHTVRRVKS